MNFKGLIYPKRLLCALVIISLSLFMINLKSYEKIPEKIHLHYEVCDKYPNNLSTYETKSPCQLLIFLFIKNQSHILVKQLTETEYESTIELVEKSVSHLRLRKGGKWFHAPDQIINGKQVNKVAIIVPYRDRLKNLKIFTHYIHEFLVKQGLVNYGIYLVEPNRNLTFNRALLLNIGFIEALKDESYECFIFHDVDMVPENIKNEYKCDLSYPKQFAISISIYAYSEIDYFRNRYLGGVTAYTKDQYLKINGYSNSFFGWGGEG
jgi:hypothetical protein